jgi:predicted CXXCH cytochrome family protein
MKRLPSKYWQEGAAHEPAQEDCSNCHSAHGSDNSAILSVAKEVLCADCHDIEEDDFTAKHKGIKPSAASCLGCHDPHGGKDKSLGSCKPCHTGGAK